MKKFWLFLFIVFITVVSLIIGYFLHDIFVSFNVHDPITKVEIKKPLEVYSIESLQKSNYKKGNFQIGEEISNNESFATYKFKFDFPAKPGTTDLSTTSGIINLPNKDTSPLVIMIRGYVDKNIYSSGLGTKNASEYLSENGYITVAPDFLGYADSSPNSGDIFESRFQTYTLILSLINSLDSVPGWDKENLFFWAHSNGGQIALTTLVINQENFPTVLWAPVTKSFPYSILFYTDESEDKGKFIRKELSYFESLYDVDKFSFTKYLDDIKAPIRLDQGGRDDAVPDAWNREFVENMNTLDKQIDFVFYPNSDHNMRPDWNEVISKDLEFFDSHLLTNK